MDYDKYLKELEQHIIQYNTLATKAQGAYEILMQLKEKEKEDETKTTDGKSSNSGSRKSS